MFQDIFARPRPAQPAQISVVFSMLSGDTKARLQLGANNAPELAITVMHESFAGSLLAYDIDGDGRAKLDVRDHESLTIIVRHQGEIVACGIFEADLALIDERSIVLVPRATMNLVVDQCEGQILQRATRSALNSAIGVDLAEELGVQ